MGTTWEVNRTVAQIHALLFIVGKPMNAEEISEVLGVARSNVSNSVKELQSWKLINVVRELEDRRDFFETTTDVWDLFRIVVEERKRREFDPTINILQGCIESPEFKEEDKDAQKRIEETMALMQTLSTWSDQMLKLKPETLVKVLKLGSKIQGFLGKSKDKTS